MLYRIFDYGSAKIGARRVLADDDLRCKLQSTQKEIRHGFWYQCRYRGGFLEGCQTR
jgi:hypothetical protein